MTISMPKLPVTVLYKDMIEIDVLDISIKEDFVNLDGTVDMEMKAKVCIANDYHYDNVSRVSMIGYKLYDSDGFVVDSGDFFISSAKVNDKLYVKSKLRNIKRDGDEKYTLELLNVV